MYFNVNFNVVFKLIKVHLLVSELYTGIKKILLIACKFRKGRRRRGHASHWSK